MNRSTAATTAATAALAGVAALALAAPAIADVIRASGEVVRFDHTTATPPYTPLAVAPAGATARVQSVETGDGKTIVTLNVSGFEGFAEYGAHAHIKPCGDPKKLGDDAKGHYQDRLPDLMKGEKATDPHLANPQNEVWLDFATNRAGEGHAKAVVKWQFRDENTTRSVIIHEKPTSPLNGTAGKRVACIDVDF